jgi:hypothetical protein
MSRTGRILACAACLWLAGCGHARITAPEKPPTDTAVACIHPSGTPWCWAYGKEGGA